MARSLLLELRAEAKDHRPDDANLWQFLPDLLGQHGIIRLAEEAQPGQDRLHMLDKCLTICCEQPLLALALLGRLPLPQQKLALLDMLGACLLKILRERFPYPCIHPTLLAELADSSKKAVISRARCMRSGLMIYQFDDPSRPQDAHHLTDHVRPASDGHKGRDEPGMHEIKHSLVERERLEGISHLEAKVLRELPARSENLGGALWERGVQIEANDLRLGKLQSHLARPGASPAGDIQDIAGSDGIQRRTVEAASGQFEEVVLDI